MRKAMVILAAFSALLAAASGSSAQTVWSPFQTPPAPFRGNEAVLDEVLAEGGIRADGNTFSPKEESEIVDLDDAAPVEKFDFDRGEYIGRFA